MKMGILWEAWRESREARRKEKTLMAGFDKNCSSLDNQLRIAQQYHEARKKYTDAGLYMRKG